MNDQISRRLQSEEIRTLCRTYHIRKLSLFGSALRDDFTPESDIDILVEFEPGHVPGLAFFQIEHELSQMFGRRVDLLTPEFLSVEIRADVLSDAKVAYEQT
jgi:predicted nucleotidyltransferase